MCKFNGKEIRTRENENGETLYLVNDLLGAIGYSQKGHSAPSRTCAKLIPIKEYETTPGRCRNTHRYWLNRQGLNALAARNAQAPAKGSYNTEWGNFLRFLDAGADESVNAHAKVEPITTLFPKIDDLIEEYQKFRAHYSAMADELASLREENARLKGIAERVKTAMAAAGF